MRSLPSHAFPRDTPLHSRLGLCAAAWKHIGASPTIRSWISHGVPIEWRGRAVQPFRSRSIKPTSAQEHWWLNTEAPRLKKQGSLFEYPPGVVPKYCAAGFMVPKGPDNFRTVVDSRPVNVACVRKRCKYDTLKMLCRLPVRGAFAIKADMQDAYYQIPVRESDRKYLAFEVAGHFYHLNCLPFGWCNSPWFFTKIVRAFVAHVRNPKLGKHSRTRHLDPHIFYKPVSHASHPSQSGCIVLPYLDDFLFVFSSQALAEAGSAWIMHLMYWLGFTPHPRKSVWEPSQQLEHLGLVVDFAAESFSVPVAKLARLRNMAKHLRVQASLNRRMVPKRVLASFCGFAQSLSLAIHPAQLFLRALYDASASVARWTGSVQLSRRAMQDLLWWQDIPVKHTSAPMVLRPGTPHLYVDACKTGWGAVLSGEVAQGSFTVEEGRHDIAVLETRAVRLALLSFADRLRDRCVLLREDNTVTEAVIRRHTSRSASVLHEYRQLWELADALNVTFKVIRVASADNKADAPSRALDRCSYMLHPKRFSELQALWGQFDVDLFASNLDRQAVPAFFSAARCPGTSGVDAFLQPWAGMRCYGCPPYDSDTMLQVVQKVLEEPLAEVVLVVPDWPSQAWFRQLILASDQILVLSKERPIFCSDRGGLTRWTRGLPQWQALAVHIPRR
jgi:hypothetical protein